MILGTLQDKQQEELWQLLTLSREIEKSIQKVTKISPQNCKIGKIYPVTMVSNKD